MKKTIAVLFVFALAVASVFAVSYKIQIAPYAIQYIDIDSDKSLSKQGFGADFTVFKQIKDSAFSAGVEANVRTFNYDDEKVNMVSLLGDIACGSVLNQKDKGLSATFKAGLSYVSLPGIKLIAPTAGIEFGFNLIFEDSTSLNMSVGGLATYFKIDNKVLQFYSANPSFGLTFKR